MCLRHVLADLWDIMDMSPKKETLLFFLFFVSSVRSFYFPKHTREQSDMEIAEPQKEVLLH